MNEFMDKICALVSEYGYEDVPRLCIELAVEQFCTIRRYPRSYTESQILSDLERNKAKIAYAAIELDAKVGVEGQTAHNEDGMNRNYGNLNVPKSYATVLPITTLL